MSAKLLMPIIRKISPTNSVDKVGNVANSPSSSTDDTMSTTSSVTSGSPPMSPSSALASKSKFRLVVMGAGGVGKTSLVNRFLYNKIPPKYQPTVEDMYATEFPIGDNVFTLELLDTSGTMRFPAMQALNMGRGDGFVLVYSVNDAESFEEVKQLREHILSAKAENSEEPVPIVVVGNKADCPQNERQVPTITAETISTIDWEHGFVETSATTGDNVVEIFRELIKQSRIDFDLTAALTKRRKVYPTCPDTPSKKNKDSKKAKQQVSCVIN